MIDSVIEHLNKNYPLYLDVEEKSFVHLNSIMKEKKPTYILHKNRQFLRFGKVGIDKQPQDLPVGRFYHLYCSGLTVGYIFELPVKKTMQVYPNFFSIQISDEKKLKNVKMILQNRYINVLSSGDSLLVVNNTRFLDIKLI